MTGTCLTAESAYVFCDLPKDNSQVWHDMVKCGTPLHARGHRKRLRS
jgi:predicted RNA-binding Zn ribbon-like protein